MQPTNILLVQPPGTPRGTIHSLLEKRSRTLYTSSNFSEVGKVFVSFPDQIKFVFIDSEMCYGHDSSNFLSKLRLANPETGFVFFNPRGPKTLRRLMGATADLTSVENEKEKRSRPSLVGNSRELRLVLELTGRYAPYDVTVLITGETGTGKELIASYLHHESPRKGKPFVSCNLAAIPESLVESELFGYKKGAFTGADKDKRGLLEAAEGGTLFLDEIGEINHTLQVKLLRLLENREYYRVGDSSPRQANVRIVAATNKELERAIVEKDFRQDLFYRLNGCRIILPALRERRGDIMILAEHFIEWAAHQMRRPVKKISSSVQSLLMDYGWPGNIRELKSVIESAFMVSDPTSDVLVMGDLPMHLQKHAINKRELITEHAIRKIDEAEKCMIEETLQNTGGNKEAAARLLGISVRTLYRKLEKFSTQQAA